jgi:hypothetical protein
MVFLIQKMWTDWMENHMSEAFGYKTVGYVTDEEEAKKIVADAGVTNPTPKGPWCLDYANDGEPVPNMRYEPVNPYDPEGA